MIVVAAIVIVVSGIGCYCFCVKKKQKKSYERAMHYAQNPAFSIEATKIFGSGVVNGPKGLFGS